MFKRDFGKVIVAGVIFGFIIAILGTTTTEEAILEKAKVTVIHEEIEINGILSDAGGPNE